MSNEEDRKKLPEWLRETQNKSWEPEIIISGLMLTSLFIFPSKLYEFCAMLIQDMGLEYISAMIILMYLSFVVSILKIFFITHLLLRLTWTGMVGLSYAFPNGVKNEKLFKVFQEYEYKKPADWVIKLETWCSILFAFPVYIGIILIVITLFLLFFVSISVLFEVSLFTLFFPFFGLLFLYSISVFFIKKTKFSNWTSTTLPSTISSIYQSNLGKWPVNISLFIFVFLSIPLIKSDIQGFSQFYNLTAANISWQNKSDIYASYHDTGKRYARAFISNENFSPDELVQLNVAYYAEDKRAIKKFSQNDLEADSINWSEVKQAEDLLHVYVNDSLITVSWRRFTLPDTKQKVFTTYLDISHLTNGEHNLRIDKLGFLDFGFLMQNWKIRRNWTKIPFYILKN